MFEATGAVHTHTHTHTSDILINKNEIAETVISKIDERKRVDYFR